MRRKKMDSELDSDHLIDQSLTTRYSIWIREILEEMPENFLITDPCLSGHPIVFASGGFLKMSGYSRDEVVGRNAKIFQGPDTDRCAVFEIREAIWEERTVFTKLLNYKKDGTPIWIMFHMRPVFCEQDGKVVHFIAVQIPILGKSSAVYESEDSKYTMNQFGVLGNRETGNRSSVQPSCSRVEVLFGSCRESAKEPYRSLSRKSFSFSSSTRVHGAELQTQSFFDEAVCSKKEVASDVINNLSSTLIRYSKLSGRGVCINRCLPSVDSRGISTSLIISLGRIKHSFVLISPFLSDVPIVYASDEFLSLTGYSRNEVVGRKSRFLQGPGSKSDALRQIEESIQGEKACQVRILSYRKNGESFWNHMYVSPVRNATGKIAFFVEVQLDEDSFDGFDESSCRLRLLGVVGAVKVAVRTSAIQAR